MAKGLSHACSSWTLLGTSFLKTGKNGGPQPKGERRGLSFFLSHPHCLYAAGRGDEAPYSRANRGGSPNCTHTHRRQPGLFHRLCCQTPPAQEISFVCSHTVSI